MIGRLLGLLLLGLAASIARAGPSPFDDSPARAGEWGFRPVEGSTVARNPPPFSWRPQRVARRYEIQVARTPDFADLEYGARPWLSVHCPPVSFGPGGWCWRVRALDIRGEPHPWSRARSFRIPEDAVAFPLPEREELLARVPRSHPRLFFGFEDLPRLRELAAGRLAERWGALEQTCDRLLADPPPTAEPPRYPKGVTGKSERWREIWWGNRRKTIRVLESASTLAFAWLLGGKQEYGELARRLLMDAAAWDPRGATGYRYNDEAGMPFAYHFSRTYTLIHPLLGDTERRVCRAVMRIRGTEMYEHLRARHLWRPYSSHANRAWHFLGEVGIAFLDEIPEAADWLWFAVNVFANVYPVWSDDDGGWHEGVNYWSSYVGRFTWWGAVQDAALGLDAYRLPYFSEVGYYAMYMLPPGTRGGGFGDLNAKVTSRRVAPLVSLLARHAKNPHWQWYAEAHGPPRPPATWTAFVAEGGEAIEARPPTDLPTARLFRGTGQVVLNRTLLDAKENVQLIFKSSPFGSQSHGYEAQNAFLLYAGGERLLIRSGYRDLYGSNHHRHWMWQTKSVNSITVNGRGQIAHSPAAAGEITDFHTSKHFDWVEGEAAKAYGKGVKRFRRGILFLKPNLFVIRDHLEFDQSSTAGWHLHAPVPFAKEGGAHFAVQGERARCTIDFLWPNDLSIETTNRFDPPPRERVKLVEHHLTAKTTRPRREITFVTLLHVSPPVIEGAVLTGHDDAGWTIRRSNAWGSVDVSIREVDPDLRLVIRGREGEVITRFESRR